MSALGDTLRFGSPGLVTALAAVILAGCAACPGAAASWAKQPEDDHALCEWLQAQSAGLCSDPNTICAQVHCGACDVAPVQVELDVLTSAATECNGIANRAWSSDACDTGSDGDVSVTCAATCE